ncbi:hypothetical protein M422DRAFT_253457 [Sphaerobolus stellatus SS14]|uniref:Uncharacterized protein n=1 Tax=Sphaerobolus stellatus (strain SS14) TaxID=990650 RepID=A0A0C9UJL9_SPHS4|nr:hypothetical protein M422DRAFT_253457 [Sphaerobolus stellatus SS14]
MSIVRGLLDSRGSNTWRIEDSYLAAVHLQAGDGDGSLVPQHSTPPPRDGELDPDPLAERHLFLGVKGTTTVEGWVIGRLMKKLLKVKPPEGEGQAIKKPPSNRTWDVMDIAIEHVVSDRQIRWGIVLSVIESKLKEIIQESVVLPYMDDGPFFDTTGREIRGGVFASVFAHPTTLSTTVTRTVTTLEKSTTRRRNDRKGHGNIRKRRTWFRKREDEVTARTLIDTSCVVGEVGGWQGWGFWVRLRCGVPSSGGPGFTLARPRRGRLVSLALPSALRFGLGSRQSSFRSLFCSSSAPSRTSSPPCTVSSRPSLVSCCPCSRFRSPGTLLAASTTLFVSRSLPFLSFSLRCSPLGSPTPSSVSQPATSTDTSSNASSSSKGKDKDKDRQRRRTLDVPRDRQVPRGSYGRRCGETARVQGGDAQVGRGRELGKGFEEEDKDGNKDKDGRDKDGKGGSGDKRDKRANKGGTDSERREDAWEGESWRGGMSRGSYRDVRREREHEREQNQSQSQDRTPRIDISSSRETAKDVDMHICVNGRSCR